MGVRKNMHSYMLLVRKHVWIISVESNQATPTQVLNAHNRQSVLATYPAHIPLSTKRYVQCISKLQGMTHKGASEINLVDYDQNFLRNETEQNGIQNISVHYIY